MHQAPVGEKERDRFQLGLFKLHDAAGLALAACCPSMIDLIDLSVNFSKSATALTCARRGLCGTFDETGARKLDTKPLAPPLSMFCLWSIAICNASETVMNLRLDLVNLKVGTDGPTCS